MKLNFKIPLTAQALLLLISAGSLMGNQGCQQQPPPVAQRELRRRVHMGKIEAPLIRLPTVVNGGGSFDFEYVANAQLARILSETQTFSNASVTGSGFFDPSAMKPGDRKEFYTCDAVTPFAISNEAVCMINLPLARLSGKITDFQMSGGIEIGLSGLQWLTSAEVKYDHANLDMEFSADSPIIVNEHYGYAHSTEGWSQIAGKATLKLVDLSFGAYSQTSLSGAVEKGMNVGFTKVKEKWDQFEPWYGMVLKACDSGILINAGGTTDAGLKVGDIVKVRHVQYIWEGTGPSAVCNSHLISSLPKKDVFAYYKVDSVGETVSWATRIEDDPKNYPFQEGSVKPGDRAYLEKFAP